LPRGRRKTIKKSVKVIEFKPMTIKQKKELLVRALTDPKFRTQLERSPAKVFGVSKLSTIDAKIIKETMTKLQALETQITSLADELLCSCGVKNPLE